jgi:hypothetical protein
LYSFSNGIFTLSSSDNTCPFIIIFACDENGSVSIEYAFPVESELLLSLKLIYVFLSPFSSISIDMFEISIEDFL